MSFCDAGTGELVGEGLLGLPRALIQAGCATSVVASWIVDDASASTLMPAFYSNLLRGWTVAQALRFAMLEACTRADGLPVSPALWANFQIVGSPAVRLCEGIGTVRNVCCELISYFCAQAESMGRPTACSSLSILCAAAQSSWRTEQNCHVVQCLPAGSDDDDGGSDEAPGIVRIARRRLGLANCFQRAVKGNDGYFYVYNELENVHLSMRSLQVDTFTNVSDRGAKLGGGLSGEFAIEGNRRAEYGYMSAGPSSQLVRFCAL